jgi:16S rRNA (guanine527-N7)-methyltransferase
VEFTEELERVIPSDIPNRSVLIKKATTHLGLIVEANQWMNLTRITSAQDAAVKHIYDSAAAWPYFKNARRVLDAGTGAGFPGIPLAIVLPHVRFVLAESIQKKARFVDSVVEQLHLPNVHVSAERAEELALKQPVDVITARAVAPLSRLLDLFAKPLKRGARLILYKGPDLEAELAEAGKFRVDTEVLCRYELPFAMGARTLVCVKAQARAARNAS